MTDAAEPTPAPNQTGRIADHLGKIAESAQRDHDWAAPQRFAKGNS
jgi:hypothetical protein